MIFLCYYNDLEKILYDTKIILQKKISDAEKITSQLRTLSETLIHLGGFELLPQIDKYYYEYTISSKPIISSDDWKFLNELLNEYDYIVETLKEETPILYANAFMKIITKIQERENCVLYMISEFQNFKDMVEFIYDRVVSESKYEKFQKEIS